jgi:cullin 1
VPTLQYEFGRLLEIGDEAHLKQIYDLLSKIPDGLDPLKDVFLRHTQEEGQAAITSLVCEGKDIDPSLYVNTIFTVHSRYVALVKGCFGSDLNFLAALGKVGTVLQAVFCY